MAEMNLAGRVALVTGASRGIGRGIAIGLAEAGADVLYPVGKHADADQLDASQEKNEASECRETWSDDAPEECLGDDPAGVKKRESRNKGADVGPDPKGDG